ncbi:MAG: hypothetical protein ACI8Y7_000102, partial [Candidatus Woesearchaeota archaeon]
MNNPILVIIVGEGRNVINNLGTKSQFYLRSVIIVLCIILLSVFAVAQNFSILNGSNSTNLTSLTLASVLNNSNNSNSSSIISNTTTSANSTNSTNKTIKKQSLFGIQQDFGTFADTLKTITTCTNISYSGTSYRLGNNVSGADSCIIIGASNITFDGAGYQITYATGGGSNNQGINNAGGYDNIVIENVSILEGTTVDYNNYGIFFSNVVDSRINNVTIRTRSGGSRQIYLYVNTMRVNITNATLSNTEGSSAPCIEIVSNSNRIDKVNCDVSSTSGSKFAFDIAGDYNNISNVKVAGCGVNCPAFYVRASSQFTRLENINATSSDAATLWITGGDNVTVINSIINTTGIGDYALTVDSGSTGLQVYNSTFNGDSDQRAGYLSGSAHVFDNVLFQGGTFGALRILSTGSDMLFRNVTIKEGTTAIYTEGYNITFENATISSGSTYGLYQAAGANITWRGGTIVGSADDIYVAAGSGAISLTNVTLTNDDISIAGGTARVIQNYYLDVLVMNTTTVQQDANVTIYNTSGNLLFSGQTDSNGRIVVQNLTHRIINATSTYYSSPYQVNTSHLGWLAGNTISVNLTTTMFKTLNVSNTLTSCGTLDRENGQYSLGSNVSATGTCFTIAANGVSLNGAGYQITYATGGTGYGLDNSGGYDNIVIENVSILEGTAGGSNTHGILLTNTVDSRINNVTVQTRSQFARQIYLYTNTMRVNITNATLSNTEGRTSHCVEIDSDSNRIDKVRCDATGSFSHYGFDIAGDYNNISNVKVYACGANCPAFYVNSGSQFTRLENINATSSDNHALLLVNGDNVTVINSIINTTGINDYALSVDVSSTGLQVYNTTFDGQNNQVSAYLSGSNHLFDNVIFNGGSLGALRIISTGSDMTFRNVTVRDGTTAINSEGDNLIFENVTVNSGSSYGLYHTSGANITWRGGTIVGSTDDIYVAAGSGAISLTNVTLTNDDITIAGGTARVIQNYYLDVLVMNTTTAQQDANVTIYNSSGDLIYAGQTDSNGRIPIQNLTRRVITASKIRNATPYQVNTTHLQWLLSDNISVNMSTNQFKTLNISNTLTSCQTLDRENGQYSLGSNVSATGTCFTIAANGVSLNGAGYQITYATG